MRVLIVDGHSMIFAWPDLRKVHARSTARGRDQLVHMLTQYQDTTGTHVVVVFDGKGSESQEVTEPGGVQIFYSAAGQTADAIAERLVARYAQKHDITVATDDSMEQQTAITFGASVTSSEGLRALLEDAGRDLAKQIKNLKRK